MHNPNRDYYQWEKLQESVSELLESGSITGGPTLYTQVNAFGHFIQGLDEDLAPLIQEWDSDGDCKLLRILVALRNGNFLEAKQLAGPLIEKIEAFVEESIKNRPAEDL